MGMSRVAAIRDREGHHEFGAISVLVYNGSEAAPWGLASPVQTEAMLLCGKCCSVTKMHETEPFVQSVSLQQLHNSSETPSMYFCLHQCYCFFVCLNACSWPGGTWVLDL